MTEIQKQITEQIESGKLLIRQTENGWLLTENTGEDDVPSVAATYKDRIFRMIFKDKKEFLMLYPEESLLRIRYLFWSHQR